ncbi:hypothetical protein CRUP_027690 [Coryphaenoides rupestris]|nr:hypothetical protein CRUP_027690 [Coryphaenoides rupestris]
MWPPGTVQETLGLGLPSARQWRKRGSPKTVRMMPLGLERMVHIISGAGCPPAEQFNTAVFPRRVTMRSLKGFLKMGLLSMLVTSSCMTITASPPSFLAMQMNSAVSDGLTLRISSVPLRWTFILLPKYGALRKMLSGIIQVIEGVGCPSAIQSMNFLEYFTAVSLITVCLGGLILGAAVTTIARALLTRVPSGRTPGRCPAAGDPEALQSIRRSLRRGSASCPYPSRILEPKIREIKSHAGSTVEMKCKAEGRPTPLISWILANRTQVRGHISDKGRASVTPEGTLIIERVTVYDRGHYKCIASNPAGAATATVRLQVVSAPPGILQDKREHVRAVMGHSLWLPCTGQGSPSPTLHWVLPDGSAVQKNRPAADPRVAFYDNGSERRVVTVTVEKRESAPRIVETSQLVTELSFGDQLRLNCLATGEPKPRIMWRLPSKAVVDQWHRALLTRVPSGRPQEMSGCGDPEALQSTRRSLPKGICFLP